MASNGDILRFALEKQLESKYDEMEVKLRKFCDDICEKAVDFRLNEPNAHDFTGNLLNSIAVALYRKGKLVQATFSSSIVPAAIAPKMTFPKYYHWKPDYQGTERTYEAEVETDGGYGKYDAQSFVVYYEPNKKAIFEIVCAYTTEYAQFVEMQRNTTGFLNTVQFIEINTPKVIK